MCAEQCGAPCWTDCKWWSALPVKIHHRLLHRWSFWVSGPGQTSAPIGNSVGDGFVDEDYHHRGRLKNSQGCADARGQDDWRPSGSMSSHDHASVG